MVSSPNNIGCRAAKRAETGRKAEIRMHGREEWTLFRRLEDFLEWFKAEHARARAEERTMTAAALRRLAPEWGNGLLAIADMIDRDELVTEDADALGWCPRPVEGAGPRASGATRAAPASATRTAEAIPVLWGAVGGAERGGFRVRDAGRGCPPPPQSSHDSHAPSPYAQARPAVRVTLGKVCAVGLLWDLGRRRRPAPAPPRWSTSTRTRPSRTGGGGRRVAELGPLLAENLTLGPRPGRRLVHRQALERRRSLQGRRPPRIGHSARMLLDVAELERRTAYPPVDEATSGVRTAPRAVRPRRPVLGRARCRRPASPSRSPHRPEGAPHARPGGPRDMAAGPSSGTRRC